MFAVSVRLVLVRDEEGEEHSYIYGTDYCSYTVFVMSNRIVTALNRPKTDCTGGKYFLSNAAHLFLL